MFTAQVYNLEIIERACRHVRKVRRHGQSCFLVFLKSWNESLVIFLPVPSSVAVRHVTAEQDDGVCGDLLEPVSRGLYGQVEISSQDESYEILRFCAHDHGETVVIRLV
jgi:hypothetical protein